MSPKRFLYTEACLRFDDPSTCLARETPLAPIFDIYEQFVGNYSKLYSTSDIVTIDEILIEFRGRCHFRMYIPTKPNKYGIKMQYLTDARAFYLCDAFIYCGKETKLLDPSIFRYQLGQLLLWRGLSLSLAEISRPTICKFLFNSRKSY
ncbi:hypothetical protein QYM36_004989 [Artemia franciscana]|uniref:PiggyBac transposable element-derived protein domain-containing protein n=1 Tax=Artemia franciscana TaxID=6661 RepID=A0AA88I6N9_ARTSF|nr:hypothetical protein QYM36_004989 [Artemia franciscana]